MDFRAMIAGRLLAAALATGLLAGPAAAVVLTYDVSAPTTGTPDPATINFTVDFDAVTTNDAGSTAGLTVNSLNFALDGDVLAFTQSDGTLFIGGSARGARNVNFSDNDLILVIDSPQAPASAGISLFNLTQAGQGFIRVGPAPDASITVTEMSVIPLPATLPLLGAALGGLALWRRRRA